MDIIKHITIKFTMNGSLLLSESTENQIKHTNVLIGSLFSNNSLSFLQYYVGLLACYGKCSVFIHSHSHQAIPILFFIPTEIE